jgi:molybdopterin-guanine dinucleotide biosynthesis protein A
MVSIAIQAGGRSSRMGRDKALVPLAGKRLIEHVLERVRAISDDLFITTNAPHSLEDLQLPLISDEVPGQGALFGLKTALSAARHDHVLIVACDMPFLQPDLLDHMLSLIGRADVIIPQIEGHFEPMLAIYRRSACLPAIDRALAEHELRMISFFAYVNVLAIKPEVIEKFDPQRLSFFNINTPEDLETAQALIQADPSREPRR